MHPDVFFGPRGASGLLHGLSHRLARDSGLHLDPLRATRGTRRAAAAAGLPWAGFGAVEGVQSAGAGGTGMWGARRGFGLGVAVLCVLLRAYQIKRLCVTPSLMSSF